MPSRGAYLSQTRSTALCPSGAACRGQSVLPVRMLLCDHGDRTFAAVLAKAAMPEVREAPAPVYLCAGHREFTMGAPADWAIELVGAP
jgi:hypothetical protein